MSRTAAEKMGLKAITVPQDAATGVFARVKPILDYHVRNFNAVLSVRQQMERLAFDAYSQGLIDGNQIAPVGISSDRREV